MFLPYVFRTAPIVALVTLGAAAAAAAIDYRSTVSAQAQPAAHGAHPGAPTNLRATVSDSNVNLSWRAGGGGSPKIYVLEAGSSSGAADLVVAPMISTSTLAADVPDGLYFVRVKASNDTGSSGPSNEIQVRVSCRPAPPTGLVANVTGNQVGLAWNASAGAKSYVLEVGSASGAANLGTTPVNGTTTAATNVANGTYFVRVKATNRCGTSGPSNEVIAVVGVAAPTPIAPAPTQPTPPPPAPTPTPGSIFGIVDASILGTCSAATHDRWVVDGGDGFMYRTWHPQTDPTGCVYGHEHGDNPASMQESEIAASPVRFGYIGRRHPMPNEPNGHEEAHEGFKVFIANRGDVNDEGRVNRVFSRSVFHMGTGGPKRFNMPHHSAEIRLIHPEFGLKAFTQLMMNTGGVGAVCDPRKPAPVKDVMQLSSPCKLNSGYEIWSTQASVMANGREVYRAFATPAVFDPITLFNPANPTEVVYAWDTRVAAIKNFPSDDWSRNRGCERESYAQPGYWYNGRGQTAYYTDAVGQPLASGDPLALRQEISTSESVGSPATTDGLKQFKMRRGFCQQSSKLGLKN
jgi:hypothetical protein